ncbi:unnamed protein product [Vitrella brassicaformis CCMP3155]|uniref:Dihydropteridine reductase n=1 Tax=Vitrella brassicaformis (strain CCMP3155) TaxID=1169540 RepID=A0A0G4FTT0_VITBC|nr:unnamed protein product [Vitrella brassicaformis CCMP3155]|mmetsp:Transcript_10683/g.25905  ORF Transcript_10683/g.25905 Transcript_10683/m.25905 type:complete len:238 (-) Transcript_10683:338-1051(-)|eukprot:CEM18352.1 unnamed protein product [Vitrella brassicaformis CCMP3155]
MTSKLSVLIYGCCGGVGRHLVSAFRLKGWAVIGCDLAKCEGPDTFVHMESATLMEQGQQLQKGLQVQAYLGNRGVPLDAIVCMSGGFAMGNLKSATFLDDAARMIHSSVGPSLVSAVIAQRHLKPFGTLFLPGAAAALNPTPQTISYGASKALVHHLVKSLASEGSGMPEGSKTVGILPTIIDTEANRVAMPDADQSTWTKLEDIAAFICSGAADNSGLTNGGLYAFHGSQVSLQEG